MDTIYIAVYVIVLLVTIFFPLYLAGRVWFAFSPFIINYYSSEQKNWYNDWNTNRFLIVFSLFAISLLLSIFWGTSILEKIQVEQIDIITILFYTLLHIICFVLLEGKMDHSFKPFSAYRRFREKKFSERFVFTKQLGPEETIISHSEEIKKEIQNSKVILSEEILQHKKVSHEIQQLATENNQLLKTSDFNFEIRNTADLILADVMQDYFISKESEASLEDFLLRKRKTGKLVFTKTARNGVSVQPIFEFFSRYTDLIDRCKKTHSNSDGNIKTRAEVVKIINQMVLAVDKHGEPQKDPIDAKNLSKFLS